MENKLAIAIVALMVAALAAPAVMADEVGYSATVGVGQNTAVTNIADALFEDVAAGSIGNKITNSLGLTNTGNVAANVNAKFTTTTATPGTYGLVSEPNVIGGSNFKIGMEGVEIGLNDAEDTTSGIALTDSEIPATSVEVFYNAILDVPAGQIDGTYTGTVQLTFS